MVSLEQDMQLFARLDIACQTRDRNLGEFFRHDNLSCPPAMSNWRGLYFGIKSDLLTCLEIVHGAISDELKVTCFILDGAFIVQMLKPTCVKTFNVYAYEIFIPYISKILQSVVRRDVVWDRYIADSLKTDTRVKRGKRSAAKGCRHRSYSGELAGDFEELLITQSCFASYQMSFLDGLCRKINNLLLQTMQKSILNNFYQI